VSLHGLAISLRLFYNEGKYEREGRGAVLSIRKTIDGKMTALEEMEPGCWVNLTSPTDAEIERVVRDTGLDAAFLRAAMDEEETSRIDSEDGQTLIVIDLPAAEETEPVLYSTVPLGILVTEGYLVTVCTRETSILWDFENGTIRNTVTQKKTNFIFQILLQVAKRYLFYLRRIDRLYNNVERQLYQTQRNRELIQLVDLEKSLVYFNTSLKANELTLNKLLRGKIITLYEEDQELLEDVLIEVRQAIEMTNIYSSIISGMMDAFSNVISNNLNVTMKVLTSITILLTIPNIIFGFYGMNVRGLPLDQFWWFPLVIAGISVLIVWLILKVKDLF